MQIESTPARTEPRAADGTPVTSSDPTSKGTFLKALDASDPAIITSEIGPSETHLYVWTIEALDGSGKVLATARAQGKFPPK